MSEQLHELILQALRFSNFAAGEGICPDELGVQGPEDFLFAYSQATDDEDWETLPERIASYVSDLEARLEKAREVIKPFGQASKAFDEAATHFHTELRGDNYIPRTEFSHGQLRAARAWMEQNDG